jgi:hypothetical protein
MSDNVYDAKVLVRENQILSIPAKRILEKTKDIPSDVGKLKRRWFWELLQNASDYNDEVDVISEIDQDKIVFKHNGKPFLVSGACNLIAPDSGKDEADLRAEGAIGQFGTGFISTHVLSSNITVSGILSVDGTYERFSFILDRSDYNDKKLLKRSISTATKQYEKSGELVNYNPGSFDSLFVYDLTKPLWNCNNKVDIRLSCNILFV